MKQGLLYPEYEDIIATASSRTRKGNKKKERKEFCLNKEELFHSELYGNLPTLCSTPLPVVAPYRGNIPTRLVPFHEAYANKDYHCTVHFYINDYLFLRVLRNPIKYLEFLQKCDSVIGPDLSQYADMSVEDRYFSAYTNSAFTAYIQQNGVNAIPNVTWSLPDSYCYSWTSMPTDSVIAINCKGIMKHDASKYLWMAGYAASCETLQPSLIVRYGTIMPGENTSISVYFENERLNYMRYGR